MNTPYFLCPFIVDGHLGGCHLWATIINAALIICVKVFVWIYFHFSRGYR